MGPTTVILTMDTVMDTVLPVMDTPMSTDSANAQLNPNLTTDTPSTVTTVTVTVVVLLDTPPVSLTLKEAPKVSARGRLKNLKKRLPPLPVPALNTIFPEPRALPSSKLLTFSPTTKETWARGPPTKNPQLKKPPLLWLTASTPREENLSLDKPSGDSPVARDPLNPDTTMDTLDTDTMVMEVVLMSDVPSGVWANRSFVI